ncbi:MAG: uracil-DNA glycosylase [Thiomonas sp.]|jgi:DNA polymerase
MPGQPTPPALRLTPQTLRWMQTLGLGPLYLRRSVLAQQTTVQDLAAQAPAAAQPAAAQHATRASSMGEIGQTSRRAAALAPVARAPADPERASIIAQMGWEELRAATEACRACKLGDMRHQAVFGTGSTRARWMIVGEAPGAEEDRQGEPFVGAAGQLLDAMLRAVGLDRHADDPQRAVYIANVLKCRPPGNRNPLPEEVARCAPWLERQIALLQPRLILALGRFAAQALLGSNAPISQLRGQVHRYASIALIVSYHPAYLLRNPADKARAWRDLCLARDTLKQTAPD